MNKLLTLSTTLIVAAGALAAFADPPEIVPAADPSRGAPAWVAESAAVGPGGLNRDFFEPHELRSLQVSLEAAREEAARRGMDPNASCAIWSTTTIDWMNPRPNHTLQALVTHARAIYSGRVVGARQGFLSGRTGTLLEVEVDRSHRNPAGVSTPARILVFYQYARIEVEGTLLCSQPERGDPPPEIGDRALVFAYRNTPSGSASDLSSDSILVPDDEELLFQRGGVLSLPRGVKDLPAGLTFDDLESLVTRMRGTGPGEDG